MNERTQAGAARAHVEPETSGQWRDTFFQRRVLRAGWGLALFVLLLIALVAGQSLALRAVPQLHDLPHIVVTPRDSLGNLVTLVAVGVATAAVTLLEQRRFSNYGFAGRAGVRLFLSGLLSGAAVLSALVFALHHLGYAVFRGQTLFGVGPEFRQGLIWVGFFAVVALAEELLTRAYLQYGLTRGLASLLRNYFGAKSGVKTAFWTAGALLSVVYGLLHGLNHGESPVGMLSTTLLGLLFVFSLWRSGSLWWALGFHIAWDWMQSFVFGTADSGLQIRDRLFLTEPFGDTLRSGGTVGPEGSIFVFPALAAVFGLVLLLRPRTVYPELWTEADLDIHDQDGETLPDPGR